MPKPENVCVRRADGAVIPCELSPLGFDKDGYEMWEIATVMQPGDALEVDSWPPGVALVGISAGWVPGRPCGMAQTDRDELSHHDIEKLRRELNMSPVGGSGPFATTVGLLLAAVLWLIRAARR